MTLSTKLGEAQTGTRDDSDRRQNDTSRHQNDSPRHQNDSSGQHDGSYDE